MSLLNDLITTNEGTDLSRLPQDVMTAIKSNIRKGADDLQQKWANALQLVHKAYEIEGAQRPDPNMDAAWKQYEENLQYAVQQLAKSRGMDDDWRMSSAVFREAKIPTLDFKVNIGDDQYIVESKNVDELIDQLSTTVVDHDAHVVKEGSTRTITFSKWGIKHRTKVIVEQLK